MILYLQRLVTVLVIGLWFGGFTCYSTFVIEAGSRIFGGVDQGYVTQQATDVFNVLAIVMIVAVAIDIAVGWRRNTQRVRIAQGVCLVVMIGSVVMLLILHNTLDAQMDATTLSKPDDVSFAPPHSSYRFYSMWLWFATVGYIALLVRSYTAEVAPTPTVAQRG